MTLINRILSVANQCSDKRDLVDNESLTAFIRPIISRISEHSGRYRVHVILASTDSAIFRRAYTHYVQPIRATSGNMSILYDSTSDVLYTVERGLVFRSECEL